MSISKQFLSGSTNGRPIAVAATSSAGTTLHTAHATDKDEVHILLSNINVIEETVIIELGGTSTSDKQAFKVPPGETIMAIPGLPLSGSLVVKAYSTTANMVNASGFVNRITA